MVYIVDKEAHSFNYYTLIALDAYTGEENWRVQVQAPLASISSVGVADGVIYIGGSMLHAFDGQTGREIWTVKPSDTEHSFRSGPSIADGVAYFGRSDGYLYAVDTQIGQVKWQFQTGNNAPSAVVIADGVLYFKGGDGYLYAIR